MANPGLGIRISRQYVADERRALGPREFAVERLGVGDWPDPDGNGDGINVERWRALVDADSAMQNPVCFAFDVKPSRSHSAISAAGRRADGNWHVEVIDHRPGTGWLPERLAQLAARHEYVSIAADKRGPAAALLTQVADLGVKVKVIDAQELAQGCGLFFDAVEDGTLRHLGTSELEAAVRGAVKRSLGDAWAWSRKSSAVDICPLVACTIALRDAIKVANRPTDQRIEFW